MTRRQSDTELAQMLAMASFEVEHRQDLKDKEKAAARIRQKRYLNELFARRGMVKRRSSLPVIYLAHPVRGAVEENLRSAELIWQAIETAYERVAICSQWVTEVRLFDEADDKQRERALLRDMAVIEKADGVILCGREITPGMRQEAKHAEAHGLPVLDCTGMDMSEMLDAVGAWLEGLSI